MTARATGNIAGIALALSLLGCGALRVSPERQATRVDALFPLAPGNAWVYEVRDFRGRVSELRARVNREVDAAGGKLTLVEESGGIPGEAGFDSARDLVAYYSRAGFIFRAPWTGQRPPTTGAGEPILPEDVAQMPTWRGSHTLLAIEGPPLYEVRTESRVTATDDTVAVPAGNFGPCLRVDTVVFATVPASEPKREIVHYYTDWYAPGVGLVKMESSVDVEGRKRDLLSLGLASFERRHDAFAH